MVGGIETLAAARAAERVLVVSYALPLGRGALIAMLALDETLGSILRTTREPIVGQMRLVWWRDALERLDHAPAPAPAQPILQAIAGDVLPRGVTGAALSEMTSGWEQLLAGPALAEEALAAYARDRGGRLFTLAATALGASGDRYEAAGEGWALADLAGHLSDRPTAELAAAMAKDRLATARSGRWSREGRALGALALIAGAELDAATPRGPRHVLRLLAHRLTGY